MVSGQNPGRGDGPGHTGGLPFSAKLACHADSHCGGTHFPGWHLCRLVAIWLLHQPAYTVRHGVVHWHRGG